MKKCAHCQSVVTGRDSTAIYCITCSIDALTLSARCSRKLRAAEKAGLLPKASECVCVDCGAKARVYDHRDYAQPLLVDSVCDGCNLRRGPAAWKVSDLDKPAKKKADAHAQAVEKACRLLNRLDAEKAQFMREIAEMTARAAGQKRLRRMEVLKPTTGGA